MPTTTSITTMKLGLHRQATFVRNTVKMIPLTKGIIDKIMPFFPLNCVVIGGYLDDNDQYWKVNYHWEHLTSKVEEFLTLDTPTTQHKTWARAVWNVLMTNPPLPERGYLKDKQVGETKDMSTHERVRARHKILKQCKKDFRNIIIAANVVDPLLEKGNPPKAHKDWWRSVAPLAVPGRSMHGTGYALDIAGDNVLITRIASSLGATLAFNEASHVHVEFAKGVTAPGSFD